MGFRLSRVGGLPGRSGGVAVRHALEHRLRGPAVFHIRLLDLDLGRRDVLNGGRPVVVQSRGTLAVHASSRRLDTGRKCAGRIADDGLVLVLEHGLRASGSGVHGSCGAVDLLDGRVVETARGLLVDDRRSDERAGRRGCRERSRLMLVLRAMPAAEQSVDPRLA